MMKTTSLLVSTLGLLLASGTALAMSHGKEKGHGDEPISKEMFMQKYMDKAEKKFERMDADGDGQISVEERKAAREKYKKHHEKHKDKHHGHGDKMKHKEE